MTVGRLLMLYQPWLWWLTRDCTSLSSGVKVFHCSRILWWVDANTDYLVLLIIPKIDDQIALLINAWCELLVLSCCYRSMSHPGVIRWVGLVSISIIITSILLRVSNNVTLSINTARQHGIEKCVEKMINFSDQLRRLKVDHYEYVSMKVIVLLTSGRSRQNYSLMIYQPSYQMQVAWK